MDDTSPDDASGIVGNCSIKAKIRCVQTLSKVSEEALVSEGLSERLGILS
jgi:hypothetical protein